MAPRLNPKGKCEGSRTPGQILGNDLPANKISTVTWVNFWKSFGSDSRPIAKSSSQAHAGPAPLALDRSRLIFRVSCRLIYLRIIFYVLKTSENMFADWVAVWKIVLFGHPGPTVIPTIGTLASEWTILFGHRFDHPPSKFV